MADFGLLQSPNFAQAALGGYQAGKAIGTQKRRDAALQAYSANPDAGVDALMTVDPALATQLQANRDKREERQALRDVFTPAPAVAPAVPALGAQPVDPAGAAVPVEAIPAPAVPPPAAPMDATPGINTEALRRLYAVNPTVAQGIQRFAADATKEQKLRLTEHGETKAVFAHRLLQVPEGPERMAAFERMKPLLLQRGFSEAEVASARLDSASLTDDVEFGSSIKDLWGRDDKLADNARADRTANRAERQAEEQIKLGRARLGVAEGALGIARQREARVGKGGSAGTGNSDLDYLMGGN